MRPLIFALCLPFLCYAAAPFAATKLSPELADRLEAAAEEEAIPVIVEWVGRADTRAAVRGVAGKARRSAQVVEVLRSRADRSRARVAAGLERVAGRQAVAAAKGLWVINGMALAATPVAIRELAADPEVATITLDRVVPLATPQLAQVANPGWNLDVINVQTAWDAGFRGQNVVVAVIDSGADVLHPDLAPRYRGDQVGHSAADSWFDPYGEFPDAPHDSDPDGHGTGVTGIVAGGANSGTPIGVAPDSLWIAARAFQDTGAPQAQALLSAIYESLQWALDPDGDPATDDAPHIVNGSWTFNNPGSVADPSVESFQQALAELKAAGMLPVFAAGNSGPTANSSESPANYPEPLAVGAVDDTDSVALFSGRGPSVFDGVSIYPSLVAPGVDVETADRTLNGQFPDSYAARSGTSYAAPHVSGAAALLLSADPTLTVEDLALELISATVDLDAQGPDYDTGYGRLDLAASRAVVGALPGALSGVTLASDLASPQQVGAAVTFTATPSDAAGPYEYRFWSAGPASDGAWRLERDYSQDPAWVWQTTASDGGTTTVRVHARTLGSTLNYEAQDGATYVVEDPNITVSVAAAPASPQEAGISVVFTATAAAGSDGVEFRFLLEGPATGSNLVVQQGYSRENTWLWQTADQDIGNSRVVVEIRNEGSTGPAADISEAAFVITQLGGAVPAGAAAAGGLDLPDRSLCFIGASGQEAPPRRAAGCLAAVVGLALLAVILRRVTGRGFRIFLLAVAAIPWAPRPGAAQEPDPTWDVQVSLGAFFASEDDEWNEVFDSDVAFDLKGGLGYKLGRWWEIGGEVGYRKASGDQKVAVDEGGVITTVSLDTEIQVVPMQAYLMFQGRWRPDQWVVPYLAGGVGCYLYWQDVSGKDTDGYLWGYHGRGGLKLSLGPLDPNTVQRARDADWGLRHTYFLVEAQYAVIDDFGSESTDLGGWSFFGGFAVEF